MPTNQPFTDEENTHLKTRLKKLEKEAIVLCATRSVLRVFPLLADNADNKDYFYYWSDKDKSKYLLAIWHILLINYALSNKSIKTSEIIGSIPVVYSNIAANITYAAGRMSAAKLARHGALAPAKEAITTAIVAAAITASNNKYIHFPDIKVALDSDISQLENKGPSQFKKSSLWQKPEPDYLTWLEKHLPDALNQLSSEQDERLTSSILNNIWPIYKGIFDGKPDQKAIDNALDQLDVYFADTDEKEASQPAEESQSAENEPNPIKDGFETIAGNRHSNHQPATEDKLNRQHLVNTLATLLQDQNNHHHQTIGLLGHWGVGKTSVVELLKTALQKKKNKGEPRFLFAEFNAWEYEHTDNLQAGIAQEMIKALSSPLPNTKPDKKWFNQLMHWLKMGCKKVCWFFIQRPWLTLRFTMSLHGLKVLIPLSFFIASFAPLWVPDSLKEAFTNLVKPLGEGASSILPYAWFIGFLYPALKNTKTLFAGPLAKELLTYLKLPNYGKHLGTIPVMREHIKKLTKVRLGNNKRLLYVVDDLDRCGHKGIVKVLEAVRMVLDLDNVIVVIAVDQRIALAALALNYKELATQHHIQDPRLIARDYLAKIIHLPIILTEPDEASVSSYLDHLWDTTSSQGNQELRPTTQAPEYDKNQNEEQNKLNEPESAKVEKNTSQTENAPLPDTKNTQPDINDKNASIEEKTTDTPQNIKRIEQLTEPQKLAFTYWVKHFELSNPRQIKRLHNSFNLLRNIYDEDEMADDINNKDELKDIAFPMMVTLFAFEYLNDLDDMKKRYALKKLIHKEESDLKEEDTKYLKDNHKITPLVIELANLDLKNTSMSMIKGIEPFVLPGIDMGDEAAAEGTKNH